MGLGFGIPAIILAALGFYRSRKAGSKKEKPYELGAGRKEPTTKSSPILQAGNTGKRVSAKELPDHLFVYTEGASEMPEKRYQ